MRIAAKARWDRSTQVLTARNTAFFHNNHRQHLAEFHKSTSGHIPRLAECLGSSIKEKLSTQSVVAQEINHQQIVIIMMIVHPI